MGGFREKNRRRLFPLTQGLEQKQTVEFWRGRVMDGVMLSTFIVFAPQTKTDGVVLAWKGYGWYPTLSVRRFRASNENRRCSFGVEGLWMVPCSQHSSIWRLKRKQTV